MATTVDMHFFAVVHTPLKEALVLRKLLCNAKPHYLCARAIRPVKEGPE